MERSCGTCEFWVRDDFGDYRTEGECRKNAPSTSMDGHMIGEYLSDISVMMYDYINFKYDREPEENALQEFVSKVQRYEHRRLAEWPETSEDIWCGEWKLKEEPI